MTDIEISKSIELNNINEIASKINLSSDNIEMYGKHKAKIDEKSINFSNDKNDGKLILVTAINPTPYGEGKTTVTIGLGDGLNKIGKNAMITLREPSLGPVFGTKGGATGGGYSQVAPMDEINLHFTGDIHAIESANNLLCAAIDNSIFQGNKLDIDPEQIIVKRSMDMNDRALREIEIAKGKNNGTVRKDGFNITVASEVMAIFCLAKNMQDLKDRLSNMLVAYKKDGSPVYARDLEVVGSMCALLKDAIKPNLVQTLEHSPALIHGGPFANIAHGTNSIIATKLAMRLSDYIVTEAGFGSDLGCEKFLDIVCRNNNISPSCIVLVATIRALKYNGNEKLEDGICNLEKHIENVKKFNIPMIVCLNKFDTDTLEEINLIKEVCKKYEVEFEISEGYTKGSEGTTELAKKVVSICDEENAKLNFLYAVNDSIKNKIEIIAKEIYGAGRVVYKEEAEKNISKLEELNLDKKCICIAKTPMSLSDDPEKLGRPENYDFTITDVKVSNGADFIVCYAGNVMTMPGLREEAAYKKIDVDDNGNIIGLF